MTGRSRQADVLQSHRLPLAVKSEDRFLALKQACSDVEHTIVRERGGDPIRQPRISRPLSVVCSTPCSGSATD